MIYIIFYVAIYECNSLKAIFKECAKLGLDIIALGLANYVTTLGTKPNKSFQAGNYLYTDHEKIDHS